MGHNNSVLARVSQPGSSNNSKGPFKNYVSMFLDFSGPPTHLFTDVILEWFLRDILQNYVYEKRWVSRWYWKCQLYADFHLLYLYTSIQLRDFFTNVNRGLIMIKMLSTEFVNDP